jgi:DNA polymerase-3 subunit epsilon
MAILFIDTETTGFPKKHGANIQDGQARVCQIAMLLVDDDGRSLAEYASLIKPNGWTVEDGAASVHGFTTEKCEQYGVSGKAMMAFYAKMIALCDRIVAHNVDFDKKMMEIEAEYCGVSVPAKDWFCTMRFAENVMKLPATQKMIDYGYGTKYKPPKLEEALQFYCSKSLGDGAHDAMFDVRACKDIYFNLGEVA